MGESASIPRLIHQIWLGPKPLPGVFRDFAAGWRAHHPHWAYFLWTDANLPPLINSAEFHAARTLAGKADVLRYELIWRYGGIYADVDFECLRPLDGLLEGVPAFIADQRVNRPINGLFGAVAEHGLVRDLVVDLPANFRRYRGIFEQTGPGFLKRTFYKYLGPKFTVEKHARGYRHWSRDRSRMVQGFESGVFCPYDSHEKHRRYEKFPHAYSVHHWAGSWKEA